jgi:hypothetical protein
VTRNVRPSSRLGLGLATLMLAVSGFSPAITTAASPASPTGTPPGSVPLAPLPGFPLPPDTELPADAALPTNDQPASVDSVDASAARAAGFAAADAMPDADWTLTGVEEALQGDPLAAFAFVRDHIRFEPYDGVLRGAAGTLAARAGNADDRAVLLKTLLDSMLVTSRYATADLDAASAGLILATAFSAPPDPLPGAGIASVAPLDPAAILTRAKRDDALLRSSLGDRLNTLPAGPADTSLDETRHHMWVQMAWGSTWLDLDPSLPADQPGTALAAPTATYDTLPDSRYQHVSLEVAAADANGGPLQDQVVLSQTLDAPTAADSRIYLYFQPDLNGLGSVILSSLTGVQNFIPQLVINGEAQRGTSFVVNDSGQELFGAASGTGRQLARLTLRITRSAPDEPSDSVESLLLDRVPPTLRGASSVSPKQLLPFTGNAGGIAQLQVVRHIQVSNGGASAYGHAVERGASANFSGSALADPDNASSYTLTDQLWPMAVADELLPLASEAIVANLSDRQDVRAVVARPRIFINSISPDTTLASDPSAPHLRLATDLLLDDVSIISPASLDAPTKARYQIWYGALESALETEFGLRLARVMDPSSLHLHAASLAMAGASPSVTDAQHPPAHAPQALLDELAAGGLAIVPDDGSAGVWWTIGAGGATRGVLDPGLGGMGIEAGPHSYENAAFGDTSYVVDPKTAEVIGYQRNGTFYKYVRKPAKPPGRCGPSSEEGTLLSCIEVPGAWAIGFIVGEVVIFATVCAVMVLTN